MFDTHLFLSDYLNRHRRRSHHLFDRIFYRYFVFTNEVIYSHFMCILYIFLFSFAPTKCDNDFYPAKTPRVLIISYLPNIYYFLYLHLIFLSSTLVSAVFSILRFPPSPHSQVLPTILPLKFTTNTFILQ